MNIVKTPLKTSIRRITALVLGLVAVSYVSVIAAAVAVDNVPLSVPNAVPGNLVLVPSVEWPTVVTHANAPGLSETATGAAYAPATSYAGYFNADLCYAYNFDTEEDNRYFYPVSAVNTGTNHSCSGQTGGTPTQKLWSGNFLNWSSMQAIDTFRLALTGGYRVNRPADGTPPNVTITDSLATTTTGHTTSYATSEQPSVTYLEKGNSDRLDNAYSPLRRLSANVADTTPSTASGLRTRIGGLRSQMWFNQNTSSSLGTTSYSYASPHALAIPVPDGLQTVVDDDPATVATAVSALPYNPAYQSISMTPSVSGNTTTINTTACGVNEPGCTGTGIDPLCSTGTTWNGTACTGSTVATSSTTQSLCTVTGSLYFLNTGGTALGGTKRCQNSSSSTSNQRAFNPLCVSSTQTVGSVTTSIVVSFPTSGTNRVCTLNTTVTTGIIGTATPQYQHTTYGSAQPWAVSIRVKVCDGTLDTRSLCTQYGSYYKPEGLLQKNAKKTRYSVFSYLVETGQQRQGGVMRARQKLISPVSAEELAGTEKPYPDHTGRIANVDNPEWDPVTGVLINNPDTLDAQATSTNIGTCTTAPDGSGCQIQYSGVINYLNRFGQINTGQPTLKSFDNLSEMFYTAVRYLRGLANLASFSGLATLTSTDIAGTGALAKYRNADGFPVIEDWYKTGTANSSVRLWNTSPAITVGTDGDPSLYQCQTTVLLGIGDTHTNSEGDQYSCDNTSGGSGTGSGTSCATWRGYLDTGATTDVRLNVAGLAYWAHLNDMRSDVPNMSVEGGTAGAKRGQTASTYWVDVVEQSQLYTASSGSVNQYYNATKYGGYTIPLADWDTNGNAMAGGTTPPHNAAWFTSNYSAWTSATANINATLTSALGFSGGDYRQPNNMFFGNNGQAMIDGLTAAFNRIGAELSGSGASLAANSTQLNNGTTTFQALYFSGTWLGDLRAFAVNTDGSINTSSLWEAADVMPAAASRVIKTSTDGTAAGVVNFDTTIASGSALRTALGATTAIQNSVINFLRGDNSNAAFRVRTTSLGDIVDSQPVFVGAPDPNLFYGKTFTGSSTYAAFASGKTSRSKRVWVAANDGMVHAFNADCTMNVNRNGCTATTPVAGAETYAYIPKAVLTATGTSAIKNLTDKNYGNSTSVPHQYFNDGELTVADVYFTSDSAWHTVLVGTTGRGLAKAVYAFDVTTPTAPTLLWERSAGDGQTGSNYIGQMNGKPIIAQTASGVWSVLIANGYNSSANSAALLQFAITTGTLTVRTTDDSVVNNGLAVPAVWMDNSANGISTDAYAGDLFGNVWRFDLSTTGAGTVIFVAKDSATTPARQPITAGILIGKDPVTSYLWIFFGTGRYFTQADLRDTSVQTWYGLIVEGTTPVSSSTVRSGLAQRTIAGETTASGTTLAARAIATPTANDLSGKSGWYLDLKYVTALGERMVTPSQFQGSLLLGTTRIPTSSDPCNPSGSGWIMAINPFTGAPPSASFFDVTNNGTVGTEDLVTIGGVTYVAAGLGFSHAPNNPIFVGKTMLLSFDDASRSSRNTAGTVGVLRRLTWREMVTQ